MIKHLSRNHGIYLGTLTNTELSSEHRETVLNFCQEVHIANLNNRARVLKSLVSSRPFTITYFYHRALQNYVNLTLKKQAIDVVICYCSSMAEYVLQSNLYRGRNRPKIKLIIDFVDLDSDKWRQYESYTCFPRSWVYKLERQRLFKYEKKINGIFDRSLFVSGREESVFKDLYPQARNIRVIPNGVNTTYFAPDRNGVVKNDGSRLETQEKAARPPMLVFTGIMDYFANEDGVKWFAEKIFSKIRLHAHNAEFYIVGNNPTNVVWSLSEIEGVTVTGYVKDIRRFYYMADVFVVPLRIARGLQNKVLEAMACGNAVVATPNAADGIKYENRKNLIIAKTEDEFAGEVVDLLKNPAKREGLGRNAIENVRKNYDWDENLKALDEILEE
jgi:sugar transferase (PEP-CTERM/EpsH1 system associated)